MVRPRADNSYGDFQCGYYLLIRAYITLFTASRTPRNAATTGAYANSGVRGSPWLFFIPHSGDLIATRSESQTKAGALLYTHTCVPWAGPCVGPAAVHPLWFEESLRARVRAFQNTRTYRDIVPQEDASETR